MNVMQGSIRIRFRTPHQEEMLRATQELKERKVKTCPFCGEKPDLIKHHKDPMWSLLHRCPVMGPLTIDWRESLSDLVRQWNTRKQ